jgi:hypothetical protein
MRILFNLLGNFTMTTRRVFILQSVIGSGVLASGAAMAADAVDEKSPVAVGLGYVADTTKADGKKYPKHTKEQNCTGCTLYVAATGACPLFAGKTVSKTGWCSAFVKKP